MKIAPSISVALPPSEARHRNNDTARGNDVTRPVVTIKKYANRRLYNTTTAEYVTLDDLTAMVKEGVEFAVTNAKSGEDITRRVLTHIVAVREYQGPHLLSVRFLRRVIAFYGDCLGGLVSGYLEGSMTAFINSESHMRRVLADSIKSPLQVEEIVKRNVALFEDALRRFNPEEGPSSTARY